MNWEAIGATGELMGAAAVLITLIYLAIQVRQNVKLTKASIRESRTAGSQRVLLAIRDEAEIIVKSDQRTPAEELRIQQVFSAMFRDWEAYIYQREQGLLDESEWLAIASAIQNSLKRDVVRKVWNERKQIYSALLQNEVQKHMEERNVGDG